MVNIVIQRGGIDGSQAVGEIVSDVIIRRGRGRVGRAIHGAGSRGKRKDGGGREVFQDGKPSDGDGSRWRVSRKAGEKKKN